MSDETLTSSRRSPFWIRAGDTVALLLVALVLAGGFLASGYILESNWRLTAWMASALLGCWGVIGWAAGRLEGSRYGVARGMILLVLIVVAWTGVQLIPLPADAVVGVSRPWRETAAAAEASGFSLPQRIPIAQSPAEGWRSWNQMIASGLFLFGVLVLATRRTTFLWLMLLVAVVGIVEGFYGLYNYTLRQTERAYGAVFNPNHHAAMVLMGLPLAWVFLADIRRRKVLVAWEEGGEPRPIYQDPVMLGFGVVALAGLGWLAAISRGSLFLATPVILLWAGVEWKLSRQAEADDGDDDPGFANRLWNVMGRSGGIAAILVVSFIALAAGTTILEGFRQRIAFDESVGLSRPVIWRATFQAIAESPITGIGLRGTEHAINRFVDVPSVDTAVEAHSDWLQILAELGIPAALVMLVYALYLVRAWWKLARRRLLAGNTRTIRLQRAAAAAFAATIVHASVEFHLRMPLVGFMALVLLACAAAPGAVSAMRPSNSGEEEP